MPTNSKPLTASVTTGASGGAHSTDEDWSIISSSSDVDDDRSTVSDDIDRDHDPLNLVENANVTAAAIPSTPDFTNSSTSSFHGSFRLPSANIVIPSAESDIKSGAKSVSTPSSASGAVSPQTNEVSSTKFDQSLTKVQEPTIGNKIKFYENLSKINESIKESSNKFYSSYAKSKIQQLNDYIIESTDSVNHVKPKTTSSPNNDDLNLEDTIELVNQDTLSTPTVQPLSTSSSSSSTSKSDSENQTSSLTPPSPPPPLPTTNFLIIEKRYIQSVLLKAVQFLQAFMESNSQYLYYYLFGGIIIGLVPTYYILSSIVCLIQFTTKSVCNCSKPVSPPSLLDSLSPQFQDKIIEIYNIYDNFLYEVEPPVKSFFFYGKKAKKINKLTRFIDIQTKDIDWNKIHLLNQNINDLIKQSHSQFDRISKLTMVEFDKHSKLGLKYGKIGAAKLSEYSRLGLTELVNQSNLLNQYIKDQQPLEKLQIYVDQSKIIILKNIDLFKQSSFKQNLDVSAITIHDKFMEIVEGLFGSAHQRTKDLIVL